MKIVWSLPDPISKWYLIMPRSILVQKPFKAMALTLSLSNINLNLCWFRAVGARAAASTPFLNHIGESFERLLILSKGFDLWATPWVVPYPIAITDTSFSLLLMLIVFLYVKATKQLFNPNVWAFKAILAP